MQQKSMSRLIFGVIMYDTGAPFSLCVSCIDRNDMIRIIVNKYRLGELRLRQLNGPKRRPYFGAERTSKRSTSVSLSSSSSPSNLNRYFSPSRLSPVTSAL